MHTSNFLANYGYCAAHSRWYRGLKLYLLTTAEGMPAPAGIFTRIAQRLLALAAYIWHNWQISAEDKRSLIAYDH